MSSALDLLRPGATIGDHQLVKKLGEGAMGTVYEAVHGLIGKRVAIKVLRAEATEAQLAAKRLLEEARVVNAIGHRGVIDIFDAGVLSDGRPYLVMELLVGHSLHEEVQRHKGGLALPFVLHVLEGLLDALAAAHAAQVIHRDLKASNVFLVDQKRGAPLVKLVDFGIALRADRDEVFTTPSTTVGSLGFMAPEHLGGKPVPQSDLYACGCLAWLMLAGKPVFPYGNPGVLVDQHLKVKPPPVSTVRPDVGPELEAVVAWLLEKRASERPFSAEVALSVVRELTRATDDGRTAPGGPGFMALARKLDAKARSAQQPQTDLTPAFVPPSASQPAVPSEARAPKVLTATRSSNDASDDDASAEPTFIGHVGPRGE